MNTNEFLKKFLYASAFPLAGDMLKFWEKLGSLTEAQIVAAGDSFYSWAGDTSRDDVREYVERKTRFRTFDNSYYDDVREYEIDFLFMHKCKIMEELRTKIEKEYSLNWPKIWPILEEAIGSEFIFYCMLEYLLEEESDKIFLRFLGEDF